MIYTAKMARKDALENNKMTPRVRSVLSLIQEQVRTQGYLSTEVSVYFTEEEILYLRNIGYTVSCQRKGGNGAPSMYLITW